MDISQNQVTGQVVSDGQKNYFVPLCFMTMLFFLWGFITVLNDILIPHLKALFDLNYTQVMMIQFCFFGAYFLVSVPAGKLVEKLGYRRGIICGLCIAALGCLLFYPAAAFRVYAFFLFALFVLASGITILQVSANPYVAALGDEKHASSRLNFAQGLNSLGTTLAPMIGGAIFFSAFHLSVGSGDSVANIGSVQLAYLGLASCLIVVAVFFMIVRLPELAIEQSYNFNEVKLQQLLQAKHLRWGVVAIFFYVGAEVSIGSFIVNYFAEPHIGGLSEHEASKLLSFYWGGAMVGRFIGAYLTRMIASDKAVKFSVVNVLLLLLVTMFSTGQVAVWSVLAIGLFNSILFPTIFTMSINAMGVNTSKASGLLCLAIVGGAIIPVIQGVFADLISVQMSFIIPLLAYITIYLYAKNQPQWLLEWKTKKK
ncbi:sugar MFS transporter [Aliikangiella sp. IMCC44359]|uniref:sugar MFS transporter n=1 Tax=Aliikangiella sp. IMCC44359 TaxID=3459125 RepID=UPI00403AA8AD